MALTAPVAPLVARWDTKVVSRRHPVVVQSSFARRFCTFPRTCVNAPPTKTVYFCSVAQGAIAIVLIAPLKPIAVATAVSTISEKLVSRLPSLLIRVKRFTVVPL